MDVGSSTSVKLKDVTLAGSTAKGSLCMRRSGTEQPPSALPKHEPTAWRTASMRTPPSRFISSLPINALALPWLNVSSPGRRRASSSNSATLRAGDVFGTTSR